MFYVGKSLADVAKVNTKQMVGNKTGMDYMDLSGCSGFFRMAFRDFCYM